MFIDNSVLTIVINEENKTRLSPWRVCTKHKDSEAKYEAMRLKLHNSNINLPFDGFGDEVELH